jgi:hypothetical protein
VASFPLVTIIPVRENSEVVIIYPDGFFIFFPGKDLKLLDFPPPFR